MTDTAPALDLDAIREHSDRYLGVTDRMDEHGTLNSRATAAAISIAASLAAADVPDLLAEVERLRALLTHVAETVQEMASARSETNKPAFDRTWEEGARYAAGRIAHAMELGSVLAAIRETSYPWVPVAGAGGGAA